MIGYLAFGEMGVTFVFKVDWYTEGGCGEREAWFSSSTPWSDRTESTLPEGACSLQYGRSVPSRVALWYFRPIDQVIFLTRCFALCQCPAETRFSKTTCLSPAKQNVMQHDSSEKQHDTSEINAHDYWFRELIKASTLYYSCLNDIHG